MNLKRFLFVMRKTGLTRMLLLYIVFYVISATIIFFVEPGIDKPADALWYTFVASSSIGFGDFCPVTHIGRIVTVFITVYEIVVAAMIPGVVVTFYAEYLKLRENETISTFLEKLEKLPELSKEELKEISERIKKFHKEHL